MRSALVAVMLAAAGHAQQVHVAWGSADHGLRLGLVYPVQDSDVFANIVAENAGAKALVVIRTPNLRGLRLLFRSARKASLERTFDFAQEFPFIPTRSGMGPSRVHDEIVRLEPGRRMILELVSASALNRRGLGQLPDGLYFVTALFDWTDAAAASAGSWTGSVKSGTIKIRLPLR